MAKQSKPAAKPKPKVKAAANPNATPALTTVTLAQLTAWYRALLASGTYQSSCEGQAFFYEACWSNDVDLERVFEAWTDTVENPENLPLDLLEEELVHAERWADLHAFIAMLDAPLLARAITMMSAFVANPKRRRR